MSYWHGAHHILMHVVLHDVLCVTCWVNLCVSFHGIHCGPLHDDRVVQVVCGVTCCVGCCKILRVAHHGDHYVVHCGACRVVLCIALHLTHRLAHWVVWHVAPTSLILFILLLFMVLVLLFVSLVVFLIDPVSW